MTKHLRREDREAGFTLIELLIVIVVLGILAAIVVFAVGGITDRGDQAACKSDYKTVQVAQEAKFAKDKAYASSVGGLVPTYLKDAPSSSKYAVYTGADGVVKVDTGDNSGLSAADATADNSECSSL